MVFYQAVLLLGYAYAHVLQKWLGVFRYARLHWVLLLLPLLFCPFDFGRLGGSVQDLPLALAVFGLLFVTVGLPFLTLSTTSLILQRWLSVSELPQKRNPYVLYSASNLGSMLALLTYPTIVEPALSLELQGHVWWGGYLIMVLLHAFCMPRNENESYGTMGPGLGMAPQSAMGGWFLLSAAACAMLLAVTNVITLDVASVPFLWVLPLSVYLLSFVLTFKQRPWFPEWSKDFLYWALMLGVLLRLMTQLRLAIPPWVSIALHLLILFTVCLNCSGRLIQAKPGNLHQLTTFYLVLAMGGLTGSTLVSWVIPLVSKSLAEYPMAFLLAVVAIAVTQRQKKTLLRQDLGGQASNRAGRCELWVCLAVVAIALTIVPWGASRLLDTIEEKRNIVLLVLIAVPVALVFRRMAGRPWQSAAVLLVITVAMSWTEDLAVGATSVKRLRNFYGVYKIYDKGNLRYLQHGTTQHGRQYVTGPKTEIPLGYYHPTTPAAEILLSTNFTFRDIGMIGLGTGALASYAGAGQSFIIYELDPDNLSIAERDFTYLSIARGNGADLKYVFGDGRVSLRGEQADSFDLLIIDAFNSGSIPVHLLTVEAFQEYFRVLRRNGLLLIHVSNKVLDLMPVVYSDARALGLYACQKSNVGNRHPDAEDTCWMALSWNQAVVGMLTAEMEWGESAAKAENLPRPWTDQYSNIFGAMFRK